MAIGGNEIGNPIGGSGDIEDDGATVGPAQGSGHLGASAVVTPLTLRLVAKRIPIRFAEYRISTNPQKMVQGECSGVSNLGIQFGSAVPFPKSALMRIWMEMPDYWARKARHVGYRHTEAPTYFQLLARVTNCEETGKRNAKYQILCQTVNLDPIDEVVLCDYLGLQPNHAQGA